ncbi:MAG TPA: acyl-CoA dehydrogenase family protein [Alphaproteobacteria bacterium]|nr:acyl-CoA dehydrogenase family protein [Alphaproteobacteria bacterium]
MSVTAKVRPGLTSVPSHDELIGRARDLAPVFFERAAETEKLRRMPDANVAALKKAGLFKVLQARRYGGYQMPLTTHIDVIAEVARGCPSTAWCMGVIHAHSWFMGLFPEKAQEETYGADPDAIISAVIAPRGKAVAVDGGYKLNGFWPFGSGCEHSQWLFLGANVFNEKGEPVDAADLLVPTAEVTLKDDWNVVALRGTGSCSIVAKDVFVPKHRYLSLPGSIAGQKPGATKHDGWLYESAVVPVLTLALAPSALGMAEAALDQLKSRLPGRTVAYTEGEVQIEQPVTHMHVADAATKIRVARLLLHACAEDIQEPAERGEMMEFAKRARVRMDCAHAVRQCLEAIEILYLASGGSGISESSPLQRAWRDVHAVNMHGLMNLPMNQEMYGRVVLGLKPNTPLI